MNKEHKILISVKEYENFKEFQDIISKCKEFGIVEYHKENDNYHVRKVLLSEDISKTLIEMNKGMSGQVLELSKIIFKLHQLSWKQFKKWKKYGDTTLREL